MSKRVRCAGQASCLLATVLLSLSVQAQDAADSGPKLEEVIVTSQRRTTDVQTTSAAVTAFSTDDLKLRSAYSVEDLNALSPSVLVSNFQGEAQIYIRGIGYSSIVGGSDSSTAFHSDGVYISRPAGALPAFMDVERVEVLRGPQGTLYGRNATGGSVNVISKGPGDHLEYEGELTVGNYDRFRLFGAIGGPVTDTIGVRLAVEREKRGGYTTLIRPIDDPANIGAVRGAAEDKDEWMARLTVDAALADNLKLTLKGDYYAADDAAVTWTYFDDGTRTDPVYQALVPPSIRAKPYSRTYASDLQPFNKPHVSGISARLEWKLPEVTFTSLTAYRETRPYNRDDLDASPVFGVDQLREERQTQVSQEFQLTSASPGRLQWILGTYFFNEHNFIRNEYFLPFTDAIFGVPDVSTCCLLQLNGRTSTRAYAVFGESTWSFTDRLQLVAGGRYSSEKRGGANLVVYKDAPANIFDNVAEFPETTFSAFTPKAGLNFTLNDDAYLYASASRGFKSGGFNPGSYQNTPFNPEKIWAYELGAKLTLFDRTLRANTAAFYYDYSDLQVQDTENNNVVIRNAAAARVEGIELESSWLPSRAIRIDANATWLDAKFTDGALLDPKYPALGVQPLSGKRLPRAPKFKTGIGAQYAASLGNRGSLTFRADYTWQDDIYFSAFNIPVLHEKSYGWTKARVLYSSPSDTWTVAAFVDNATNVTVATNKIFDGDIIGSAVLGNLAPPRTYGLEFTVRQ